MAMLATLTSIMVLAYQQAPSNVNDLSFMAGSWTTHIWGGTFEENWNQPADGSMQGVGRLRAKGKTTFLEFMSIETGVDGKLRLWIIQGELGKGEKKPEAFLLSSLASKSATFERDGDDFPNKIVYSSTTGGLECVISGIKNDKEESERFVFKREPHVHP